MKVLILGGTGGIGSKAAERLINDGADVFVGFKSKAPSVAKPVQMDVCDPGSVASAIGLVLETGPLDAVVFSVSANIEYKTIDRLDWEDFDLHMQTQVRGLVNVLKGLWPQILSKRRTKFVVLLTEACIGKPPSRMAHYVAAKYGLLGLVKSLSSELSKYGCTFNTVSPGLVDTDLVSGLPRKMVEIESSNNPLGRIATPQDVAGVISFLCSDDADYLNGADITVNGGSIMR